MNAGLSLLIVDDSDAIRELVSAMMCPLPGIARVTTAASVAHARQILARDWPDIVVLDIGLPDGNGIDLLRAIRRTGRHASVVMLTNRPAQQYREGTLREGADFFVDKATRFDELAEIVADLVGASEARP